MVSISIASMFIAPEEWLAQHAHLKSETETKQ
jgi:hypothetical protein